MFDLFKAYGKIVSAKLETYPNSKESREFAYVQFQKEEEAEAAIEALNDKEFKGKKLEISKLNKKEKKKNELPAPVVKKNNLFIKNVPDGTTDEKLKSLFERFGPIESVSIQKGADGNLKDYGYVCFKD